MASRAARKIRSPEQQLIKLARRLLPAVQVNRGGFTIHEVQNRSDADQRHMERSGEKRTIRKLTRIEKLQRAKILHPDLAQACEWYATAYALGYDTIGVVADYGRSSGHGSTSFCHLSRYKAQREARDDYLFARAGILPWLLPAFEKVVLEGCSIEHSGGKNAAPMIQLAAWQLHGRIAHLLPVS